jgi:membrane fusion protein, multidrug efflux system
MQTNESKSQPRQLDVDTVGALPETPHIRLGRVAVFVGILILIGVAAGFWPRWLARRALVEGARELSVTSVAVVVPVPGKNSFGTPLSAEVRAYVEAPIYARASGFLKRWLVDIGDQVKAGDLLAEIDTPEIDQQLSQARAELAQAEATLDLAKTTATRWTELLKTSSVSEQETAEKQADLALKMATVDAVRANVNRLADLKRFGSVIAPFDGTITVRQTDVGQLITAGGGKELFHLAQTNPLRVYVRVPQSLSRSIKNGQKGELLFDELPGRKFDAKVVRSAGAMEPGSRTLLVELQVDNARGELLSGGYAQVRFSDAVDAPVLTLPSSTLLFRSEGIQVGVVADDGKVGLRTLKLGRDFGQTMEILEGIAAGDRVIINPPDSLANGQNVRVVESAKSVAAK